MAVISCKVSDGARTVEVFAPDMIEVDESKLRRPYYIPPISNLFAAAVGKVALVWSSYENEFDLFLDALIRATEYADSTAWKKAGYQYRARLFRSQSQRAFAAENTIITYCEDMLNRGNDLVEKRNAIAHGRLTCKLEVVGPDIDHLHIATTLYSLQQRTAKTSTFTPESLDDLYYELAYLSGLIHRIANYSEPPDSISLTDRKVLQTFLHTHHLTYADRQNDPKVELGASEG